jgi:hypothetical protein
VFLDLYLLQALDPKPLEDRFDGLIHLGACRQAGFALATCGPTGCATRLHFATKYSNFMYLQ